MHLIFLFIIAFGSGAETASLCDSNPCKNGGTCYIKEEKITCSCPDYVKGDFCEIRRCGWNPCKNGGKCMKGGPDICLCTDISYGEFCEIIKDEYLSSSTQPPTTESMTSSIRSMKPNLPEDNSTYRTTTDEVILSNISESDGNILPGVFTIVVPDQTATGTDGQSPNVTSVASTEDNPEEKDSDYRKLSTTSIYGHSKNPCKSSPCQNGGTCKVEEGEMKCVCPDFVYGGLCERSPCNPNPCKNGGECEVTYRNEFDCNCQKGYSGRLCETKLKDEYLSSSTQSPSSESVTSSTNRSMKTNLPEDMSTYRTTTDELTLSSNSESDGVFTTAVPDGQSLNVTSVATSTDNFTEKNSDYQELFTTSVYGHSKNPCESSPCQNGGTCRVEKGEMKCVCPDYVEGEFCDSSPCNPNPCNNGGECEVTFRDEFDCNCQEGYAGRYCETERKPSEQPSNGTATPSFKTKETTTSSSEITTETTAQTVTDTTTLSAKTEQPTNPSLEITTETTAQTATNTKAPSSTTKKSTVPYSESTAKTSGQPANDSFKNDISSNSRFTYSGGLAVGGGLLAIICLVSAGWYIKRRYRRNIFRKTKDDDTNSVKSDSSNSSQNHLV